MIEDSTPDVDTTVIEGATGVLVVERIGGTRWIVETLGKPQIPDGVETGLLPHAPARRSIIAAGSRRVGSILSATSGAARPGRSSWCADNGCISIPQIYSFSKDIGVRLVQLPGLILIDQVGSELCEAMGKLMSNHIVGGESVAQRNLIPIPDGIGAYGVIPVHGGGQCATTSIESIAPETVEQQPVEISGSIVGLIDVGVAAGSRAFRSGQATWKSTATAVIDLSEAGAVHGWPVVEEIATGGVDQHMLCEHLRSLDDKVMGKNRRREEWIPPPARVHDDQFGIGSLYQYPLIEMGFSKDQCLIQRHGWCH